MNSYLPDFKISLRVNNQITITRQRLARKDEPFYLARENENHSHSQLESVVDRYHLRQGGDIVYDPTLHKNTRIPLSESNTHRAPLDIIDRFQRYIDVKKGIPLKSKRGYGDRPHIRSFSAKSGQKLRECGAAVDILCDGDPSKCRVITLTLPASGEDAYTALSNYSAYASNRLFQIIRRKKDDRLHYFYCIEHQKRGALHWHICLFHQDKQVSEGIGSEMVSLWRDILRDIGLASGVDLLYSRGFGRQVTPSEMQSLNQEMRKGCGAYFSKYAAKNHSQSKEGCSQSIDSINAQRYPCSSYWGRSRNLAKLCQELSFKYKFEGIEDYESESLRADSIDIISQFDIVLSHSFSFKKEIELPHGKLTIMEGETEVFYVSQESYSILLKLFRDRFGKSPSSSIPERAKRGGYLSIYESEIGYF